MKILIDARLYGLEHAGPGRYVKNLVDSLSKQDDINEYIILLRKKYFDEMKFPSNFKKVLADYDHYTFNEQLSLPSAIKKQMPDVVHFPFFNVPILYFGKFAVTIHDLTMHKFKGGEATTRGPIKYLLWRIGYYMAFYKAAKCSAKIIVPSEYVKDEVVDYYKLEKSKVVVTYEGVDDAIKSYKSNKDVLQKYKIERLYFIYSGSAYPHKNLKRAIEAVIMLNKDLAKKVILVITSSRTVFTKRIKRWLKEMNAEEYVKFVGFVPDKDLASLYKGSLAFIYPTLSEGFGLPGLEAMSCETLVIASDIKVLKEVYQDSAIYFDPNDSKSINECMKRVVKISEERREAMVNRNLKFVTKYSWDKMTKETMNVYKNISAK